MKSVVFTTAAIVLVAAAGPSSARTIRIPITRVGTVPVPCANETLGTRDARDVPQPLASGHPAGRDG